MKLRLQILPGFLFVIIGAFLLYELMILIEGTSTLKTIFPYQDLQRKTQETIWHKILWFVGDMTEAQFYKSILGSIGLIAFAFIAHLLFKKGSKWAGFPISYGTGLWPWVFVSSLLGLAISNILYIHHLSEGWIPTFVAFVSIPAGVVLIYGKGWAPTLTGAILGGVLGFPIAWFVIQVMLVPLQLPNVIGNVTGMWLGAIIVFEICRYLPWLPNSTADTKDTDEELVAATTEPTTKKSENKWFIRRILADFTEPQFYGNELATIGLLIGAILSWFLNPIHPFYGSGLFPALIFGQFLTLAISNFLYYDQWEKKGWYPTFVPVVSVAPAVIAAYDGTLLSIVGGAIFGAIISPPIAQMVIEKSPKHWHPVVGNTFSMALSTLVIMLVFQMI